MYPCSDNLYTEIHVIMFLVYFYKCYICSSIRPQIRSGDILVLCQEKVQIKYNQFSLCLAKLNLLFLSHFLLDFSDILPHIGLGINTRNGCEYVLYCKMFLCIQKSTYMHVYN